MLGRPLSLPIWRNVLRIKYSGFLLSDATSQLKRFPLPEPPTDEEMRLELAGIARLEEALEAINVSPERMRREIRK